MTGGVTGGSPRTNGEAVRTANRLHLDIHASGGRALPLETRMKGGDAEAQRLAALGATVSGAMDSGGLDHYAVGMRDPADNEFEIN
jgi:hypothetical protein